MSKASAANAADGSSTRLSVRSKTFYGIGSVAFGVSTLGLSSAVLQPYLNRVIGLPALWVGTAIMLTLMLDAVIDPAVGQWSDKLRTRWGRRHPFMYAAAVGGAQGVDHAITLLRDEVDRNMAMLGATSMAEITKDCLRATQR